MLTREPPYFPVFRVTQHSPQIPIFFELHSRDPPKHWINSGCNLGCKYLNQRRVRWSLLPDVSWPSQLTAALDWLSLHSNRNSSSHGQRRATDFGRAVTSIVNGLRAYLEERVA